MGDHNEDESGFDMEGALNEIDDGLFGPEEGDDDLSGQESNVHDDPQPAEGSKPSPTEPVVSEDADAVDQELVLDAAPKTWRKEAAAHWGSLPPSVQQEIAKREQDMFRGIEGYKQEASIGQAFRQIISPYLPILQQHGLDAGQHVASLLQAHHVLATGTPDQKAAIFNAIAQQFGIDPDAQAPYVDPQVQALQAEVAQLRSFTQQQVNYAQQQQFAGVESQVASFAAKPENVYFDELAPIMTQLLNGRVVQTLEEAYDKAIYLHPEVREKELARQAADRKEQARIKALEAKKATGANVRSSTKSVSGTAPLGSIDDTLQAAYEEILNRG